jgi:hypothetical protein
MPNAGWESHKPRTGALRNLWLASSVAARGILSSRNAGLKSKVPGIKLADCAKNP